MIELLTILRLIWEGLTGKNLSEPAPKPDPVPEPDPGHALPRPSRDILPADTKEYGPATAIVRAMKRKGYKVFEDNKQDFNLNIVGVRDSTPVLDRFGCKLYVFWKRPDGTWKLLTWPITTYPGRRYLIERLLNPRGAAILKEGQWPVYSLDTHNGKYEALCQRRGEVEVFRDGNRDRVFDLKPSTLHKGWFGINIHAPITPRSGMLTYIAQKVGSASAGCQVTQKLEDFLEFRQILRKARAIWGNAFTYTLLKDLDVIEENISLPDIVPPRNNFDEITEWKPTGNTAGVRNKNLLNVKQNPKNPWKFSTGYDDRMHTIFPGYAKGLRAGIKLLSIYWTKHKKRTIADILSRWAPASDTIGSLPGAPPNSPKEYSLFVASRMDVSPNVTLDLFNNDGSVSDADQLYNLVAAMSAYENYSLLNLPREVFDDAVDLL